MNEFWLPFNFLFLLKEGMHLRNHVLNFQILDTYNYKHFYKFLTKNNFQMFVILLIVIYIQSSVVHTIRLWIYTEFFFIFTIAENL